MSQWAIQDKEKMRMAIENIYMLANRKRVVIHNYNSGKPVAIGPKSDDTDWDHIIRFCESAGIRQSIIRTADK